jgi:predicted nucleic acid-binding protein
MNDRSFFDATILVYAVSEGDSRAAVAESLLAAGGYISVQVLNEFAAIARRKLNMPWEEIGEALAAVRTLCKPPSSLTVEIHDAGMAIAAQYGCHIYDSLILAAALDAECDTLYSEDMQNGRKIGSLTIRNPFVTG